MPSMFKSEFDELKSLGLTPQQIKDAVEEGKKLKTDQEGLRNELNSSKTAQQTLQDSFNEVKNKLGELEASARTRIPPKEPQKLTTFLDDEDAAFDERFNQSAAPLAKVALEAARNSAKLSAELSLRGQFIDTPGGKIELSKLWTRWLGEIDKASSEVALHALGNTSTWINLFDYILGKHMRDLLGKTSDYVESVQTGTNVKIGNEPLPERLDDEQTSIANRMSKATNGRITAEKYNETRKNMKFVNV